ncbi:MAG: SDR family oxidoreductase [Alphaproteobacteria bacterium]|nr:SDR family oxidoreductase [Alphaproteobacteria bacterium]
MTYQSVFRPGLFDDRVVVITGGGSGIGRCTAHELAALGATVVITGRNEEKLRRTTAEIVEDNGQADWIAFDIRDEEATRAAIAEILNRWEKINGLVNNAGGQFTAHLEEISLKGWEAVVKTNLNGGFLVSREAYSQCMKNSGGAIVNMLMDNWNSAPFMSHSGAARAGMMNFTKTAALEWAPSGVRVNAVAPGTIASSGLDTYGTDYSRILRKRSQQNPMKRLGTEAEVSAAITFLLSDAAAYISGTTLRVDGAAPNYKTVWEMEGHTNSIAFNGFHRSTTPQVLDDE